MRMSSLNPQVAAGVKFNKTNSFDLTGCIIGKFVWSLLVQLIAALGSHDTAQRGLHRCWVIPLFFCGTFISSCVFIRDKAKRSRGQSRNCLKQQKSCQLLWVKYKPDSWYWCWIKNAPIWLWLCTQMHTLTQAQRNCCLILSGQRGSTGISQWVTTSFHTRACTHVVVYSNVNDSDRMVQDKWKRSDQIWANTHECMQNTMRVNQLHINNARNIQECTLQ